MNQKVYHTLEYHKIKQMLTALAGSSCGQKLCMELEPFDNLTECE